MAICLGKDAVLMFWRHFVQQSGMISAILVKSHMRNISVKLFRNQAIDLEEDVV